MAHKKRPILGLTERITVYGKDGKKKELTARIDTGATKSAIHKDLIEKLGRGPIIGKKVVKSSNGQSTRSLVNVMIQMKGFDIGGDFTLADRSHLKFKVLIGQNLLKKQGFLIDPSKK